MFEPKENNEDIFDYVSPLLKSTIRGVNTCVVAYGASGSGKSHTMIGDEHDQGVVPRAIKFIFENSKQAIDELDVHCSMYEIYNEMFIDLLLKYQKSSQSNVKKILKVKIETVESFHQYLNFGINCRKTACTKRNQKSSRSHLVIKLFLKGMFRKTLKHFESTLVMLDCAGPESANDHIENEAGDVQKIEMPFINKSYTNLATVIESLKKSEHFVDFRSSKLTRELKPYLTGDAKTLIIATCSQELKRLATSKATFKIVNVANRVMQNETQMTNKKKISAKI